LIKEGIILRRVTIACEGGPSQFDDVVVFKPSIFFKAIFAVNRLLSSSLALEKIRILVAECYFSINICILMNEAQDINHKCEMKNFLSLLPKLNNNNHNKPCTRNKNLRRSIFPIASFLEAKVGNRPSLAWRSISSIINLLEEGLNV
jgi:hypothetical protein